VAREEIYLTDKEQEMLQSASCSTLAEGHSGLKLAVYDAVRKQVLVALEEDEEGGLAKKAYFMSAADPAAGAFLGCASGLGHSGVLQSEAFRIAMRFRMLAPQLDANGQPAGKCHGCGISMVHCAGRHEGEQSSSRPILVERWSHAAACTGGASGTFISRHNRIVNELSAALKSAGPTGIVELEKTVLLPAMPGEEAVRASTPIDLWFRDGKGKEWFVDVAVADPGCPSYLAKGAATGTDVAAKAREEDKRRAFAAKFRGVDSKQFVPFVLESTGRIGPSARKFLNSVALSPTRLRRVVERISMLCASHLGRLVQRTQGMKGA
jgi:hypothetical protein